jgi:hypothetical protein
VTFTIDDARMYIGQVRWQFAKTMPQWPHEYTVREWRPDLDRQFAALADMIRTEGIANRGRGTPLRPRYHHPYLKVDGGSTGPWAHRFRRRR